MDSLRPPKKNRVIDTRPRRVFEMVIPYIMQESSEADFRTILSLSQVCRRLRYWNVLRRFVGYLALDWASTILWKHSFPTTIPAYGALSKGLLDTGLLHERDQFILSPLDSAAWPFFRMGNYRFGNCYVCNIRGTVVRCFYAATFSELVLFVYESMQSTDNVDFWLIVCGWKTVKCEALMYPDLEKHRLVERQLLGRMKRLGVTSPDEIGFRDGPLPHTSYSWFSKVCETSGTKLKRTPLQRMKHFVDTWFPRTLRVTDNLKPSLPYEFEFQDIY